MEGTGEVPIGLHEAYALWVQTNCLATPCNRALCVIHALLHCISTTAMRFEHEPARAFALEARPRQPSSAACSAATGHTVAQTRATKGPVGLHEFNVSSRPRYPDTAEQSVVAQARGRASPTGTKSRKHGPCHIARESRGMADVPWISDSAWLANAMLARVLCTDRQRG